MIELPKLPYKRGALGAYIGEETINVHYSKHHKGYVDNLNKLIEGTNYEDMELDEILKKAKSGPIFNNAAQTWNHTFYWNSMTPSPLDPKDELGEEIKRSFGGFEEFKKEFKDKATKVFGSGWCWLILTSRQRDKEYLAIETTPNADRPGGRPLLVCDVWEHAYYLDYQNDRGRYIEQFFRVANWQFVLDNMDAKE